MMSFMVTLFKKMLRTERKALPSRVITKKPQKGPYLGRVLFSYLAFPLEWNSDDPRFNGHSNNWESCEIVHVLNSLGFIVDCIDWNSRFHPEINYDVVFDIHKNLQAVAPFLPHAKKILYLTGSYSRYQNAAELRRVENLERRRNVLYVPKRLPPDMDLSDRSLHLADHCLLIGNDYTRNTYPENYHHKMTLVPVSGSHLAFVKSTKGIRKYAREFLWCYGGGAVHKGLDLVLEVFAKNPTLTLNIVGNIESERDFFLIYKRELTLLPNIRYHGYLLPSSSKFIEIVKRSFCFIAPSCSEAISAAAVTCLQLGLFPIISRDNGIMLPFGTGIYLEHCTTEEIEHAVYKVYALSDVSLQEQLSITQTYALQEFSRENFTRKMTLCITKALSPG